MLGISDAISTSTKQYKKKEKESRVNITLDSRVEQREIPSGGILELQDAVRAQVPWAEQFLELTADRLVRVIDRCVYVTYMTLLFSAMYAFAAQGRIGGLQSLEATQYLDLARSGYAMASVFKTSSLFQ